MMETNGSNDKESLNALNTSQLAAADSLRSPLNIYSETLSLQVSRYSV